MKITWILYDQQSQAQQNDSHDEDDNNDDNIEYNTYLDIPRLLFELPVKNYRYIKNNFDISAIFYSFQQLTNIQKKNTFRR